MAKVLILPAIGYSFGVNRTGLQARTEFAPLQVQPDSDLH